MTVPTYLLPASALLGSTLLLAACGGSDGTDAPVSGTPTSSSTASTTAINTANAKQIAANAFMVSGGMDARSNGNGNSSSSSSSTSRTNGPNIAFAAVNQIYTAQNAQAVAQLPSITVNCNPSGSATIQLTTARRDRLSSGDTLSLTANNCIQDTDRVDGAVTVKINNVTGTPSATTPWNGALSVTFNNFVFDDGRDLDGLNGDISLSFNQTAPQTATFAVTGNSLRLTDTRGGATVERTLSAFNTNGSIAGDVLTYRTNFTLQGDVPQLGNGTFTVNTTRDFVQRRGDHPSAGVLVVRASDNTSLTLTTVDTTSVNIAADVTGDGVVDSTFATTWDELETFL